MPDQPPFGPRKPSDRTSVLIAHVAICLNFLTLYAAAIAPLVIWLAYLRRSPWVGFQAFQALVYQVATTGIVLLTTLLVAEAGSWTPGPAVLMLFWGLLALPAAYGVYAGWCAYRDPGFLYPVVGPLLVRYRFPAR